MVGVTTAGAYGHAVGKSLAFAYVDPKLAQDGQTFEILMQGERRERADRSQPAWDPKNERLRG